MSRSGLPAGAARAAWKSRVLVGAVVGHKVHDHAQAQPVGFRDHAVEVGQRAEQRVDVAVVADVVAGVALRRPVEGGEPDGVHVQFGELRELRGDAGQIADAVSVQVAEGPRVHLVDDGRAPPAVGVVGGVNRGQRAGQRAGGVQSTESTDMWASLDAVRTPKMKTLPVNSAVTSLPYRHLRHATPGSATSGNVCSRERNEHGLAPWRQAAANYAIPTSRLGATLIDELESRMGSMLTNSHLSWGPAKVRTDETALAAYAVDQAPVLDLPAAAGRGFRRLRGGCPGTVSACAAAEGADGGPRGRHRRLGRRPRQRGLRCAAAWNG